MGTSNRPYKLYTPGPVNIPSRVSLAATANYHHRTVEFRAILAETLEMLKPLFGTQELVIPIHTTGRGALEGVYNNLFTQDDVVLTIANGNFGEMAAKTLKRNNITCIPCFEGWETQVNIEELEKLIVEHKATAITSVHNDTSNAVLNPIAEIGELAHKYNLLFVVDTVSSLGALPFELDKWHVDAAVTASQKGLMSPTGLSFAALSAKAYEICEKNNPRDFYINIADIRKNVSEKGETPGSTPVSLITAVHEALLMIHEEGLENVYERHRKLSSATKIALEALGFEMFPKVCDTRSDSLTVCTPPKGANINDMVNIMNDEFRIVMAKGLGGYADNVIRVANLGYYYTEDMLMFISALEFTMHKLGIADVAGKGTRAFIEAYQGK